MRPSRVQHRILESIEEWRQTICQTSRYKEDLGFIRDMHRLLLYKGYAFPEVRREDAAVLNPSDVCVLSSVRGLVIDFTTELAFRRGNGGRRERGAICQIAGAHSEGYTCRSTRSEPVDEGHGGIRQ